jgi:lysophospholipase L1-like esterase
VLTLAAGCVGAADSAAPGTGKLLREGGQEVRIVCFGDSITGIYYHTGGLRAWPEVLEAALRQQYTKAAVRVINAGISGNTTTAGLARMEKDVLAFRPHLVVAMFGMNDLAYGPVDAARDAAAKAGYRANLETIARRAHEAGAEVILMTPNSVYPDAAPGRPPERIAEFAATLRDAAGAVGVPVVDAFAGYERIRRDDVRRWRRMMSETIHPSLAGHQAFAEWVAGAICGTPVALAGVVPSRPCLKHTATALQAGGPVTVVVPDVLSEVVCGALREADPAARIVPVVWPVRGQSLAQIEEWAKGIRQQAGLTLVVGSLSPAALTCGPNEEAFVRQVAWVACWSLAFGQREWDVLFVSPTVADEALTPEQQASASLAQGMVAAHDLFWVEAADATGLEDWLRRELQASRDRPR